MALFILQHVILTVVFHSMTSHAAVVSRTYPMQVNATGSAVCAVDKPSVVIPMSVRAMKIQCGGKCNELPYCKVFQLNEELRQCELFHYWPSSFSTIDHCTAYANKELRRTPKLVVMLNGSGVVFATALLDDQLFAIRYTGTPQPISVYSTQSSQLLRTITIPGLGKEVRGMVTSALDNYLYVSDKDNQRIHRVDLSVTSTVSVVSWSLASQPYELSITSEKNVLVGMYTYGGYGSIVEYTPSGSIVRAINNMIHIPWRVVQLSTNVWAYTCVHANVPSMGQICTTQTSGTVIKCFGSGPTPVFDQSLSLVIASSGYTLIADHGLNKMLVVDPTLTSSSELHLPVISAMQAPIAISYDESRGRLCVGEAGGLNRALVFDGVWF